MNPIMHVKLSVSQRLLQATTNLESVFYLPSHLFTFRGDSLIFPRRPRVANFTPSINQERWPH